MNENRRRVLEMTADGKLSADEAERLLSALDEGREPDSGGFAPFAARRCEIPAHRGRARSGGGP